jgi:hypothetical protein
MVPRKQGVGHPTEDFVRLLVGQRSEVGPSEVGGRACTNARPRLAAAGDDLFFMLGPKADRATRSGDSGGVRQCRLRGSPWPRKGSSAHIASGDPIRVNPIVAAAIHAAPLDEDRQPGGGERFTRVIHLCEVLGRLSPRQLVGPPGHDAYSYQEALESLKVCLLSLPSRPPPVLHAQLPG